MNSNGSIKNPILESKIKFAVAQVLDQAIKAFAEIQKVRAKLYSLRPSQTNINESFKIIAQWKT